MTTVAEQIAAFFAEGPWAVAGASTDRSKYGNRVLRAYKQNGKAPVYPINPRETEIEGLRAYPDLASCPEPVRAMSIITPPSVTEKLVEEAAAAGVEHVWMQPGAESAAAVEAAEKHGMSVIHGGPCALVVLGFRDE